MKIQTSPFIDMHVHLREPGQTHKETIETGTNAAYCGGIGAVLAMPNTLPPIDTAQLATWVSSQKSKIKVYPVAAITIGQKGEQLADFAALKQAGVVAVSDDGLPVVNDEMMKCALIEAAKHGLTVISHCEPETEMAIRDIMLAEQTGCRVHIAHVSLKTTIDAVKQAKKRGVNVTAETCPHYLVPWAIGKMNPPLATQHDVNACIQGLIDGTIDCISTDHAPHTEQEKSGATPPNGVIGLETSLAVTLMALYHTKLMSLDEIFAKMRDNPAKILGIPIPDGTIEIDTEHEWIANNFVSKSSNSAFFGKTLKGKCSFIT